MFHWLRRIVSGARGSDEADDPIPIDLGAIPGAVADADGLPRPQWQVIRTAADALSHRFGEHRVWCEVERQWLEALVAALGEGYRIVETRSVLLLCARSEAGAASLARMCEGTLAAVESILGAPAEPCGKLPVFVFDSQHTYYDYVSHFYSDGEYGTSGGMCIREDGGDVHVATVDAPHGLERTLAHEMVHALLDPNLPTWVEEGIAEVISRRVARSEPLTLDPADVRRQQHHWAKHGLDSFWSGESFQRGDRGQGLSYALAEVLVQNLLSDHRRALRGFLDEADSADAGEAASLEHFGVGLGALAAEFLGEGNWTPRRDMTPPSP
jgi:hypothetical protein